MVPSDHERDGSDFFENVVDHSEDAIFFGAAAPDEAEVAKEVDLSHPTRAEHFDGVPGHVEVPMDVTD
jgi:hypothetical protein